MAARKLRETAAFMGHRLHSTGASANPYITLNPSAPPPLHLLRVLDMTDVNMVMSTHLHMTLATRSCCSPRLGSWMSGGDKLAVRRWAKELAC